MLQKIIEALKECKDPELGYDIYTLGLIYDIKISSDKVDIKMTLTSPMCPFGPQIINDVKLRVGNLENVKDVNIDLVFEPLWEPSEDVKLMLGV